MNKLKIIIAEDNREFSDLLKTSLERDEAFDVRFTCFNGLETLAAVEAELPDVLLLDLIMPEVDGYSVLAGLKAKKLKPPLIIVVSQIKSEAFIEKALQLGANYYMCKPVAFDVLRERILEFSGLADARSAQFEGRPALADKREKRVASLDEKIANIFISVGIPAHIKGYQFLREAIKMAIGSPEIINNITKRLYPDIAEKYDTSSSKVERAIRHAIEVAWSRGKIENINQIFGIKIYTASDKPTNGEFIALLADKMLLEGA
ncbi:MAG: sporulation transcription factor Spo0A [Clostridiales bacterium]|jgi:two-component system response regulator (stage 0 sporulation protein A)|nr:sporulation transcription factor Spo0A [Clostridiales bacterium]